MIDPKLITPEFLLKLSERVGNGEILTDDDFEVLDYLIQKLEERTIQEAYNGS